MPNGGSDCCGTCWFTTRNQGQAGFRAADRSIPAHCTIRDLPPANPFYIYCANHPHRCPERDPIPIGPTYTGDSSGRREVWQVSPDTEAIRQHLLDLLAAIPEKPATEYPIGAYRDEVVVWQLGEFRDVLCRCRPPTVSDFRSCDDRGRAVRSNPASFGIASARSPWQDHRTGS